MTTPEADKVRGLRKNDQLVAGVQVRRRFEKVSLAFQEDLLSFSNP